MSPTFLRSVLSTLPALALLTGLGASPAWAQEGWRAQGRDSGRGEAQDRRHPMARAADQNQGPRVGERYGEGQRQPRIGESRLSGDRPPPDRRGERPASLRDGSGSGWQEQRRDRDRDRDDDRRHSGPGRSYQSSGPGWQPIPRSAPPRPGYTVYHRPPASYHTVYLGSPYWFYQGAWYSQRGNAYVVVRPPVGLYMTSLPYYHRVVYVGPSVYYVAHDVYYAPVATGGYQVVEPPAEAASAAFDYPIAYPARNQSAQQQADDQFQCHEWAVQLSQFDPTLLGSGQPMNDSPTLRDNYVRAWSACMEGRGYSVR
ncbi:DUF6515 family protein [Caldimonas caldifontis]|nr:DUF6515 family protein [Caldimonas caldifontis]